MSIECIAVLTNRGKTRILSEGGSQSWRLNAHHAGNCKYVICVQNRKQDWGEPEAPHYTAFLIGKISGISRSQECSDRWMINISEYADINIPDFWDGNHNPVSYWSMEELGIDESSLQFTKLEAANQSSPNPVLDKLTIEEAKRLLANNFGVKEEDITITINF